MRYLHLCLPLLVVLASCGSRHSAGTKIVATVSGHIVTETELDVYTKYAATFDSVVYPDSIEAHCATLPRRPICARFRVGVLARLIEERVVLAYAHRHHLSLSAQDRAAAQLQLQRLMQPAAPTARLFRLGVSRRFVARIVQRQLLVQRVEESVVGPRAISGPEFHIVRIGIPASGSSDQDNRTIVRLASTGKLPYGAAEKIEWMAPVRMAPGVRRALDAAKAGDYVGPFSRPGYVLVIKLVRRATHRYASPARAQITSRLFRSWLATAVARARPQCMGTSGTLVACPRSMMKSA